MNRKEKLLSEKAVRAINQTVTGDIRIMEVCGTHTHQIARLGIPKLLTPNIHLLSGPGCPVCVTEPGYIDALVTLLERNDIIVATFGDLLRLRGSAENLEQQKAAGKKVTVLYSPEEVLALARAAQNQSVVLAAVGFETTAPLYAALVKTARAEGIDNLYLLTSLKRMEPAIRFILERENVRIDGMLCPGHVAAVTGTAPFRPITEEYGIPAVISGFEAMDLIASIGILCGQIAGRIPVAFRNLYPGCVSDDGNRTAQAVMQEVLEIADDKWRGIGTIKSSALVLNHSYESFDALKRFDLCIESNQEQASHACECGAIMIGEKTPELCVSFGRACTPEHPIGPCMVSSEGACAAYYRYGCG